MRKWEVVERTVVIRHAVVEANTRKDAVNALIKFKTKYVTKEYVKYTATEVKE